VRIVRSKLSTQETSGNLTGLYLAELNRITGDVLEAILDDGRELTMGAYLADMIDVIYGLGSQVGITREDLSSLRMARYGEYGPYENRTKD